MRRILLLLTVFFSLSACQQEEILSPPTNVRYQEETILWDSVEGATFYNVMLNNVEYSVTKPLFDMHDSPNGDYTVRVSANKKDIQSNYSNTVSFTVARIFDHPTDLIINEGVMTWQEVDDADSYVVLVNDVEYPITDTIIDLSFLDENKTYELRVKAVFDLGDSAFSSPITYLTYYDIISTYRGKYNINLPFNLLIQLEFTYAIEHVFYNDSFLDKDDFAVDEDELSINYDLLQDFSLGEHIIKLYTPNGVVELCLEIIEDNKPVMISSNSIDYVVGQDIELLFELFGGSFEGLGGHDITETDYEFKNGTLTIYAEYLDPKIATFEGSTIIFFYQLKRGDNIQLGYIFIRIT